MKTSMEPNKIRVSLLAASVVFILSCFHGSANAGLAVNYLSAISVGGSPVRLAADRGGIIYVAVPGAGKVLKFFRDGSSAGVITASTKPLSVDVDGAGKVYVSDYAAGSVLVLGADGQVLYRLGKGQGEFGMPGGIAVSSNGLVYVTDSLKNVVKVYNTDGSFRSSFGGYGTNSGQMKFPTGICSDDLNNEIYVVDQTNGRVEVFDPNGVFKRTFGRYGGGQGQLIRGQGIQVAGGKVYVADAFLSIVEIFDTAGNFVSSVGSYGSGSGGLKIPMDVAVVGSTLYVANSDNGRIEIFDIVDPQGINVSPLSLSFEAYAETNPPLQTMQIDPEVAGTQVPWTATVSAPFGLNVSASAGTSPAQMTVGVDVTGLPPGMYTGAVILHAGGNDYPVTVTLAVSEPAPQLLVSPAAISLSYQNGNFGSQTISVSSGGGALSWSAATNVSWLSLSSAAGTTPGSVVASLNQNVASLTIGTYNASVTITAPNASGGPAVIPVTLTVSCSQINVAPSTLPDGSLGASYSQAFTPSGGAGTVTFSESGTLPAGMTFSGGVLAGTPSQAGTFPITITATAQNGCTGSQEYEIHIWSGTCLSAPSGLVAWWPGNGNANDVVGGSNGTLMNGAIITTEGKAGPAFSFDGQSGYMAAPPAALSTDDMSLDSWVKWDGPNAASSRQLMIYSGSPDSDGYGLFAENNGAITIISGQGTPAVFLSDGVLSQGTWHNVSAVRTGGQWTLYLDGAAKTINAGDAGAVPDVPTSNTVIGGVEGGPEIFNGLIDEIQIYNRALTAQEIADIHNAGSGGLCPDKTAPTVSSTSPANGATGVSVNTAVTVTFAKKMDPATINGTTFALDNGAVGTAAYDQATMTAVFTPSPNLAYGTLYTVTVASGVKDLAGNTMLTSYTWSFTTACPAIVLSPSGLPGGTRGSLYNQSITASGGKAPYTYVLEGDPDLKIDSASGMISGTPTLAGTFSVTVTATDANGCTGSRALTFTVQQQVLISPPAISLTYQNGVAGSQEFSVCAGGGTLSWSASTDVSWLTLSQESGTTPANVTASVNNVVSTLTDGVYSGVITITALDAGVSPVTILVTLTVARQSVFVTPTQIDMLYQTAGDLATTNLSVGSVGAPLNWSVRTDAQWLTLKPLSGTTPSVVAVALNSNVDTLAEGTYTAQVVLTAPDAVNSPLPVPVTVKVVKTEAIIVTSNLESTTFTISGITESGSTVTLKGAGTNWRTDEVKPGTYTIHFDHIKGYRRPADRTFDIKTGGSMTLDVRYSPLPLANVIAAGKGPDPKNDATIRVLDLNGGLITEFLALDTKYGARVAMGDIDGDGVDEIIVAPGPGPGNQAYIKVFRYDSAPMTETLPVPGTLYGGFVAVGDIDGDGRAEIAVSMVDQGGAQTVIVYAFNGASMTKRVEISLEGAAKYPAAVALGDLDSDGRLELVCASSGKITSYAFDADLSTARIAASGTTVKRSDSLADLATVAAGDIDGEGSDKVLIGYYDEVKDSAVQVLNGDLTAVGRPFKVFDKGMSSPAISSRDSNGDGHAEIIAGQGARSTNNAVLKICDSTGRQMKVIQAFDSKYGVNAVFGAVGAAGKGEAYHDK